MCLGKLRTKRKKNRFSGSLSDLKIAVCVCGGGAKNSRITREEKKLLYGSRKLEPAVRNEPVLPGLRTGCLHALHEKEKASCREELSVGVMLSQLEAVNDLGPEFYMHTKTPSAPSKGPPVFRITLFSFTASSAQVLLCLFPV